MSKTVVGLFSTMAKAEQVRQTLISEGFESRNIRVMANDEDASNSGSISSGSSISERAGLTGSGSELASDRGYTDMNSTERNVSDRNLTEQNLTDRNLTDRNLTDRNLTDRNLSDRNVSDQDLNDRDYDDTGSGTGIGAKISHFFKSLTGGDDDAHEHYASGINSGGALLAVTAEDDETGEVAAMLQEHGAREIEGASGQSSTRGAAAFASTGSANREAILDRGGISDRGQQTGEQTIPVVEEELSVGKREIDRGGVRVYSHTTERPAEADVTLREERINVERRPVNRPATAADFTSGNEQAIELHATSEEAVVGKTQRVVEEVSVGKQTSERTESIHDTVRKTEVEVENLAGTTAGGNSRRESEVDAMGNPTSGSSTKDRF